MELRDYQNDCVTKIDEMIEGEKKIAFLATGAGKTIIMSYVASKEQGRVLICVDQSELRQQTIDKLSMFIPVEEIGSVQGKFDEVDKRVVVATRQSLTHGKSTRLDRMIKNGEFGLLMVDETHRAVGQVKKIIDKVNAKKVVGFTATPYNKDLKEVYSDFVFKKEIIELVEEGYLCSPRCLTIYSDTSLDGVGTVAGEFNLGQLDEAVNTVSRNKLIVNKYKELGKGRKKTLCFCTSIEHAEVLANEFNKAGIKAKNIDSTCTTGEREDILRAFKEGEIEVLTNIGVLTTGFDEPSVDCIVMARPTKSKILFTQCAGRGLRIFEGKDDCLILDVCDVTTKNSMNLMSGKSIFDLEENETIAERKIRIEKEKEEHEKREKERIEREKIEAELLQKEIDLFNENLENIYSVSNLHWFFTGIKKLEIAILSVSAKEDYYVYKEDQEFICYRRKMKEGFKYDLDEIDRSNSLKELVENIDSIAVKKGSSFVYKKAKWKFEEATPKQKESCKANVKTKWGAHCYFSKRNCYFTLKDVI